MINVIANFGTTVGLPFYEFIMESLLGIVQNAINYDVWVVRSLDLRF